MPTSEKRLAANRANAAKSTGPKTPEGKERSRLNATSHGLTAQTSVLPGEDRGELEELSASLMRQLDPRGVLQRLVAERIVSLAWKLRRVARAEETVAWEMQIRRGEYRTGEQHGGRSGASLVGESIRDPASRYMGEPLDTRLTRLTEYELKLDGALRAAIRELRTLKKDERFDEEEAEQEETAPRGTAARENEPTGEAGCKTEATELPRPGCVAPAASDEQTPGEKTNPTPASEEAAEVVAATDVAAEVPGGSSAPAPGTSAFPPPGPRP